MRDNSDLAAKTEIRQWAVKSAGGKKATVLELFGGEGHMHDTCYKGVKKHLAFDLRPIDRGTWLQGQNRVLLKDNVQGWSVYDADAYGNPWLVLTDVCRLRGPGEFAMVATCGVSRRLATGDPNKFLKWVTGYNDMPRCGTILRFYDDMVHDVFRVWKGYGVNLTKCVRARSRGNHSVWYYAISAVKTGKAMP